MQELKVILKKLRKEHNHTQENLAEKLLVSRQTVSNWETGKSTPDAHNIQMLANIYGESIFDIFHTTKTDDNSRKLSSADKVPTYDKNTVFFIGLLNIISIFIPLAAILSVYIVIEWQNKIPNRLFKSSFFFLTFLSLVNVAVLLIVIIYFIN